jgi:hypothetical protein
MGPTVAVIAGVLLALLLLALTALLTSMAVFFWRRSRLPASQANGAGPPG